MRALGIDARSPAMDRLNRLALRLGYHHAARSGITSLVDARVFWKRGYLDAYQWAEREGVMTAHTTLGLWAYPQEEDAVQIPRLAGMFARNPQRNLQVSQIKIYADGITTMSTATLLQPYRQLQLAGPLGLNYFSVNRLQRYVTTLEPVGFDFHIHAIGDRGAQEALDAIEFARSQHPQLAPRHRITHLELVDPVDVARFANLDVIADFQMATEYVLPSHAMDLAPILGRRRLQERSLPLRSLWNSGAHVVPKACPTLRQPFAPTP